MRTRRPLPHTIAFIAWSVLLPQLVFAQATPVVRSPIYAGECVVSLAMTPVPSAPLAANLEVRVNGTVVDLKQAKLTTADGRVTVWLGDSFTRRDKVQARVSNGEWSTVVEVQPSLSKISCKDPSLRSLDERPRLSSVVLVGGSSETFAPEVERFQKDVSGAVPGTRERTQHQLLSEFSLDYRLTPKERRGLWLLTRGRYFAQQANTCTTGSSQPSLCVDKDNVSINPNQAFKNVNNAQVAEFVLGARYEFAMLDGDDNPVAIYGEFTHGSLFVGKLEVPAGSTDAPAKVYDKSLNDFFAGVGISVMRGRFRDTYVETGAGLTEIFAPDSGSPAFNRRKTTAMLVTDGSAFKLWNPIRFFVRFSLDRARGPDSFRTSYGGIVDLNRVFGGPAQ